MIKLHFYAHFQCLEASGPILPISFGTVIIAFIHSAHDSFNIMGTIMQGGIMALPSDKSSVFGIISYAFDVITDVKGH